RPASSGACFPGPGAAASSIRSVASAKSSLRRSTSCCQCSATSDELQKVFCGMCSLSSSDMFFFSFLILSVLCQRQKHLSASKHGRETPHTVVTDEGSGRKCVALGNTAHCRKEADHLGTATPAEGAALIGSRRDERGARL